MEYTIYDTATGLIHSHGSATTLTSLNQILLNDGDGIIEGFYNRETHKIENGAPVEYTPDIFPIIRNKRDGLLLESDWTQTEDSPLTDAKKAEWATYRQALRDLPSQYSDNDNIDDVVFPTQPD
jgi:hypothetical protein